MMSRSPSGVVLLSLVLACACRLPVRSPSAILQEEDFVALRNADTDSADRTNRWNREMLVPRTLETVWSACLGVLARHSLIVQVNDRRIEGNADLRNTIRSMNVGDQVRVKYYRDGELRSGAVELFAYAQDQ